MQGRKLLVLVAFALAAPAVAEDASMGPVIGEYGPAYTVDEMDVGLPESLVLKTVFDIGADPAPGQPNRYLVAVARFLNMHARHDVAMKDMQVAVVIHGAATRHVVASANNPNRQLIRRLQDAGVEFYLCGQSMKFYGIEKQELLEDVSVGLSAMTMLTILQADDYALIPWGA